LADYRAWIAMTAFKKFDPHAFLERERLAPDRTVTLASLATLAGQPLENEICWTASKVLSQCDTGAVTAKSIEIQRDDYTIEHGLDQLGKNQSLTPTPAKVAKVAKDRSRFGSPPAAFDALERKCPAYVDVADWQQAIEDGHKFLARWGEQAEALGWTGRELFGLHPMPERPAANYSRLSRHDSTGLIWLLHGRAVIALTETEAAILGHSGAIQKYRKHDKPPLGPLGDSLDDTGPQP
jgi:hypothetical protein